MRSPKQPPKLAMLLLLAFLLLCNGVGNVHGKTIHENSVDLRALLDFKQGITDPYEALSNWNTTTHFCRWNGVNCTTTRPFRVSSLNLTGQNIQGQITPSLGNLTFLTYLDLSVNNFVGPLPMFDHLQQLQTLWLNNNRLNGIIPSLGHLTFLTSLDLSVNNLQGIFPDALTNCSNLAYLDLHQNHLTGVIPPRIGNLSKLVGLSLFRNNFTGIIPPPLVTIATLMQVSLAENQLSGQIPHELWQMPKIKVLQLDENSLSGGIPQTLTNISSLKDLSFLSLSFNMLSGALPSNIGDALPSLQILFLGVNTLEGHIPASLGNASMLQIIDLSSNYFTGKIPSSFRKLSGMTRLNLEENKLEANDTEGWKFFDALANCRHLNIFSLSNNQLEGVIPNSIGNLSINLHYLLMGGNKLSGIVPPSIGKFRGLIELSLDDNNLTGTIDKWIGKLVMLQLLNLQMNKFIGTIPPSISNLSQLTILSLAKNQFTGSIPPSLGNLQHTLTLNLSYNNLYGVIPVEFGNLAQLTTLDLSSNKFSGEIPISLGQCPQLVTIQMDQNVLIGNVPTTFRNLYSLTLFNLSHNNLSGPLPASLNDLKLLSKLDLSYNTFQGEIPISGVFENATVVLLDGNPGLCGGTMDLHMPPCLAVSHRSEIEYYLVRALIPLFGFMSLVMLTYVIITGKKTSRRTNLFLLSFGKKFPRVSYKDLNQATENFSQAKLLGRGSYGSVYRGKLTQAKIQVAIKVFDLDMKCADKSFVTECDVLRSIRHRNLLPILTACSTIDNNGDAFKALIYEFMPNGNLDTWLHSKFAGGSSKCLSLAQRATIAVGIADALAYLHNDCERQIVHCDLKPTNILLDNDMIACLGDFGIASLVGHSGSNTSVGLKGTIGYIAPEYAQSGQASITGDVYSFGVVLLEMLIGKRPTDPMFENELNLVNFVERNYPDQILHIIDAHLQGECEGYSQANITMENAVYVCLLSLMQVALSCTRLIPRERMIIREVTTKLHSIKTSYIRETKREQVMLHQSGLQ